MSECIDWPGRKNRDGYGVRGKKYGTVLVHRQVAQEELGDIAGWVVRHKCDNRACINPDHLELGTQADNIRDMIERGRKVTADTSGEKNGRALITEDMARHIKYDYDGQTHTSVANQLGIARHIVSGIRLNKTWRHL